MLSKNLQVSMEFEYLLVKEWLTTRSVVNIRIVIDYM